MNLNVVKTDQVGAKLLGHCKAVALGGLLDVGRADAVVELDFLPDAGVDLLTEFDIGAETARGDHHGAGVNDHLLAEVLGHDARDRAVLFHDRGHGRIKQNLDGAVGAGNHLLERADVRVARGSGRIVAALPECARSRADLVLELHAERLKPFDGAHGVLGEVAHQGGIALVVAAFKGLLGKEVDAVLDALLALTHRVDGVQGAFGDVGRAPEVAQLFKNDHVLGARLMRRRR